MKKNKVNFKWVVGLISLLSINMLAFADANTTTNDPNSPVVMLNATAQKVISELKANESSLKDKSVVYGIVNRYLIPQVDVNGMARSVLGRNAWTQATDTQKTAFTKEFVQLVVRTYANPLSEYTDETIHFAPIRGEYQDKQFINVNSMIVRSQGNNVPLSYSLVRLNNEWKIYDMSVEGVSLLQSFRSQFAEELSQGNMEQLIQNLQKHNQQS